ncbi:hypothetical protein TNCV_3467651 [Trichonephila clavipes]|nr:hypothetical protein TNCV_3467651 [Trichonephila clavipes]
MSNTVVTVIIVRSRRKIGIFSYEDLLIINGNKYSTFQEAGDLSKSGDFINEVPDDAASVITLTEVKWQERILRKEEQIELHNACKLQFYNLVNECEQLYNLYNGGWSNFRLTGVTPVE